MSVTTAAFADAKGSGGGCGVGGCGSALSELAGSGFTGGNGGGGTNDASDNGGGSGFGSGDLHCGLAVTSSGTHGSC